MNDTDILNHLFDKQVICPVCDAHFKVKTVKGIDEVIEGLLAEISLVGLPADFESEILKMSASLAAKEIEKNNFELNLLIN